MFELIKQGAVSVLQGNLPLNRENVEAADILCEPCFERGQPKLVIDMSSIPLIDSSGLEWLLDMHVKAASRGGRMAIANPTALCMDILRVTEIPDRCRLYSDVLAAVGSYVE